MRLDAGSLGFGQLQGDGGWVYTSGAGSRAKDRVQGIWIRAYDAAGKLLAEYANPSTVAKKNTWKE